MPNLNGNQTNHKRQRGSKDIDVHTTNQPTMNVKEDPRRHRYIDMHTTNQPTINVKEDPEWHRYVDVHKYGELSAVFAVNDLAVGSQEEREFVAFSRNAAHVLVNHPVLFPVCGKEYYAISRIM